MSTTILAKNEPERLWSIGAIIVSILVAAPVVAIGVLAIFPAENIWVHLASTVLPGYVTTTLLLMAGVGFSTFVIGTGTAWLVTTCRFPGRKVLQWALLIPLAMPTYIIAYTYVDMFEYSGVAQTALRTAFGWTSIKQYWFPEIRSLPGAIFVMSFVLYPYVYLTSRATFLRQSAGFLEVSRTLGRGPWGAFYSVALPMARPAIVVGVSLAMMETLNDIGAVEFFGVNTLTVGIYVTWLGRSNLGGAAQIAMIMLAFVFLLIWLERAARRHQHYHDNSSRQRQPHPVKLSGGRKWLVTFVCSLPIVFGFVIPGIVLVESSVVFYEDALDGRYWQYVTNSLLLSSSAAVTAVLVGCFLAYAHRLSRSRFVQFAIRFSSIGYAVPGAVLGIGILIPLARLDNFIDALAREFFGFSTGLIMTGTMFALIFAYLVRFLAVSYGAVEAGLTRVTPSLEMAARTLGRTATGTFMEIHLPLLRPAIGTAGLLVFVDVMKELPATLILRPFNFDTLATHVYTLASLELLEESALSALTIVAVGVIPVILLSKTLKIQPHSAR
jgi:iron(III) transport system permease protein